MAELLKRITSEHPYAASAGPDDRSLVIRGPEGLAIYDLQLERCRDPAPQSTVSDLFSRWRELRGVPDGPEAEYGREYRRRAYTGDGQIRITTEDGRSVASYPFDRVGQDGVFDLSGFDRSGECCWLGFYAECPESHVLYIVEVSTGRIHRAEIGYWERVWLLPDWGVDRAMWVCHHDCEMSPQVTAWKHTMGEEYKVEGAFGLDGTTLDPDAEDEEPSVTPVHCRDGKLAVYSEGRLWTYGAQSQQVTPGPKVGDGVTKVTLDECPRWEWSARDWFAMQFDDALTVHNSTTLKTAAVIPIPKVKGTPEIRVLFLADGRVVVTRPSESAPKHSVIELWQL